MPFTRSVTLTPEQLEIVFDALKVERAANYRIAQKCKQEATRVYLTAKGDKCGALAEWISRNASQFGL